ncbi:unnamed protein product, partial [Symbiodinium necroappetens]
PSERDAKSSEGLGGASKADRRRRGKEPRGPAAMRGGPAAPARRLQEGRLPPQRGPSPEI